MENRQTSTAGQVKLASGLNIALGAWLAAASFLLGYSGVSAARWNDIIIGLVVLVLAWARVANPSQMTAASWFNVILGLWLIAAPFVLGYSGMVAPLWNDIIIGVAVAALGTWSALATNAT